MTDDAAPRPPAASPTPPSTPRRATIYDVARVAEVSHQTVSRYLQGYQGIRQEKRDRVEAALQALDYRMNLSARSLRSRRSHRIIAIGSNLDQVGPSRTAQGAIEGAREAGYLLDLIFVDVDDRSSIDEAIAEASRHDAAGILTLSSTDEMVSAFADTAFTGPVHFAIEEDDARGDPTGLHTIGLRAIFDHLCGLGHRRFLHISGPSNWVSARNRAAAYDREIAGRGLNSAETVHGDWSPASGYAAIMRLPHDLAATAIVVANDQMALGAMLALEERGLRVPDDVSVVGFDGIPEAEFFHPPLTTVAQNFGLNGREAFSRLLRLIEGPAVPEPAGLVGQLIVRRSTGPARG